MKEWFTEVDWYMHVQEEREDETVPMLIWG
jgi:hypothetical protein